MTSLRKMVALQEFARNHKRHLVRLRRDGSPEILTVNGKAELVVQDLASYKELLDRMDHAEAVAGIRRGFADVDAARTRPAKKALAMFGKRPARRKS